MVTKDTADGLAIFGAFGAAFEWLPQIAAFFALIWTLIRIFEWARVRLFGYPKDMKL